LGRKIVYNESHNSILQTHTITSPLDINCDIAFNNSLFFVDTKNNLKEELNEILGEAIAIEAK
jgi:hypothetical protein